MMKYDMLDQALLELIQRYSITTIVHDSRKVEPGCLFIAIRGSHYDGNNFIEEVIVSGAILIATDSKEHYEKYCRACNIVFCDDARVFLAEAVLALDMKCPDNMIGVTGTNGKSSAVFFIQQILSLMNISSASIGTLGVQYSLSSSSLESKPISLDYAGLTTPDVIELAKILDQLTKIGIEYCAMEASSIGIDQKRLWGRKFKVAGFTSFSQDHLDYHGSMEEYLECKMRIFTENLAPNGYAILNNQIPEIDKIIGFLEEQGVGFLTYGTSNADFEYKIIEKSRLGQKFILSHKDFKREINTNILGSFQIANIVLAIVSLNCFGMSLEDMVKFVPSLSAPSGRLEAIANEGVARSIFIDYAHTPDAIGNALHELQLLKGNKSRRLICVFGCGGNRDTAKRALMGQITSSYADIIIVTDDNPRTEEPALIRREILSSCPNGLEIGDREEAIKAAIESMNPEDIILIAGKGHENYQIIGNTKLYFSDKEIALKYANQKSILKDNPNT